MCAICICCTKKILTFEGVQLARCPGSRDRPASVMQRKRRASTSFTSATTTYPSYPDNDSTTSRLGTGMSRVTTSRSKGRPRTAASTITGDQQIICAISESRGLSPVVGLAFVNVSTAEAVLCQISDNQTYPKTEHKLFVFQPTEILFMTTAAQPESKLYSIVKSNLPHIRVTVIDRKYWAETTGMDYMQQLALTQDLEALKVSVEGNYYAICCFAAVCCLHARFQVSSSLAQLLTLRYSSILSSFSSSPSHFILFASNTSLLKES